MYVLVDLYMSTYILILIQVKYREKQIEKITITQHKYIKKKIGCCMEKFYTYRFLRLSS